MDELDIDIANACRTCLTIESDMVDIFSSDEENERLSYVDILLSYTPLKIQLNDGLPFQICKACVKQIRGIHTYIQKCIRTDTILHEFINKIKNRLCKDAVDMHQIECRTNIKSEKNLEEDADQYAAVVVKQKTIENRTSDINKINNLSKPKLYPCKKCDNYFLCWEHLSRHNSAHPKINKICCRFCNKEFIHARHIQPHITAEHFIEIIHVCGYCDEKYCNKSDLENHIIQHIDQVKNEAVASRSNKEELLLNKVGPELSKHTCEVCNKDFVTNAALRRHIVTHDPDKLFNCPEHNCKWSFSTESELSIHINVNHNEEGKPECQYCQKVFKHKRNLRQHMLTHRVSKRFICKYCPKGFNHLHHLQNHERIHTKDTPYLCSDCGKGFAVKDQLRIHMRLHNNEKPYKCNICDKAFTQSHSFRAHVHTHTGERPYMCSLCGKRFSAKSNLTSHINNVHNAKEDRNTGSHKHICLVCCEILDNGDLLAEHMKKHTLRYQCHICKKDFALNTALESHIKTHSAGDRSHVCEECGASFNRSEHLRSHIIRKHTDIKAYKCHMCERSFAQSCDLTTHVRRHTGEKPFTCQICDRSFAQSNTLTVHMRTHTGEKPYVCTICNKGHCSSGALRNHMRIHNKITNSDTTVS